MRAAELTRILRRSVFGVWGYPISLSSSFVKPTLTPVLFQTRTQFFHFLLNCHPIHAPLHLRPLHVDPPRTRLCRARPRRWRQHPSLPHLPRPWYKSVKKSTRAKDAQKLVRAMSRSGYQFGRGRRRCWAGVEFRDPHRFRLRSRTYIRPSASQEQERGQEQERERERPAVPRSASTPPAAGFFSAHAAGNIFTRLAGPRGGRAISVDVRNVSPGSSITDRRRG
jgi:hypothetical protein